MKVQSLHYLSKRKIAEQFGSKLVFPCDVAVDAEIDNAFAELAKHWDV